MNTEKPLIITGRSEIQGRSVETCDARDLHAFLGVKRQFANWMQDSIRQFGFVEGLDFGVFNNFVKNPEGEGGRPTKEYALTLNMARELCMLSRTAKGKQARLYFIECERRALTAENAAVALTDHDDEIDADGIIRTYGITDGRKVTLILDDGQIVPIDMDLDMVCVGRPISVLDAAMGYRILEADHCHSNSGGISECAHLEGGYIPCWPDASILLCPKNGHPIPLAFKVTGLLIGTSDEIGRILNSLGWSTIQCVRVTRGYDEQEN